MITDQEIVAVLRKISAYDKRKPDQFELDEFANQARRHGWTFQEACEQVEVFFSVPRHGERIGPGDITAGIKAERRRPKPVGDVLALEAPKPTEEQARASAERRRRAFAQAIEEIEAKRRAREAV